jgi:hypothetical protein
VFRSRGRRSSFKPGNLEALAPKNLSAAIIAAPYIVEFEGSQDERAFDLGKRVDGRRRLPDRHRFGSDSYVLAYVWVRSPDGRLYELTAASWPDSTTLSRWRSPRGRSPAP